MLKKPLLILHGALGADSQFTPLIAKLKDPFEIHTFNFSGHGGQPFEQDFSIAQFASELKTYINMHNLKGVDVFGYSMGGYVALFLAKGHPEYLGKIFTLGTKFNWTPESASQEVKMLNPEKIEEKVPAFASALKKRHAPNDWKEVLIKTKEMMLGLGNGGALKDEEFKAIRHQVIINVGDEDNMVSQEESHVVASHLPHGEFKVHEGFKHPIEQVDIDRLAGALITHFH